MGPRTLTSLLAVFLLLPPSIGWAQLSYAETLFHDSVEHYKKGRYRDALKGFMGVIVEDPSFPKAREYITLSGQALKAEERARLDKEREAILADINQFRQDKPNSRRWRSHFKRALKLAADPAGVCLAMASYREALEAYAPELGDLKSFRMAKTRFYEAYWASHWSDDEGPVNGRARSVMHDTDAEGRTYREVKALELAIENRLEDAAGSTARRDDR
jgi:tetratricopeptide (TPR) repeat protein